MPVQRAIVKSAALLGCIVVVGYWAQGCVTAGCVRNSDCGSTDMCHAGTCMPRGTDAGATGSASGSGGTPVMPRVDAGAVDASAVDASAVDAGAVDAGHS